MPALESLSFFEALSFWEGKIQIGPKAFSLLSDRAKVLAFGVSRIAVGDELDTVYKLLDRAIRKGTTFSEFQSNAGDIFDRRGWTGSNLWKLDSIFRTNIQTAYNVGQYEQLVRDVDVFPYWMYSGIEDERIRPTHLAMSGRVWPANHPIWDTWFPPNGFLCRCSVIGLTESDVTARGLTVESSDPTGQVIPLVDDEGVQQGQVILQPDTGFAVNPGKVWFDTMGTYAKDKISSYPSLLQSAVLAEIITESDFAILLDGLPEAA